MTYMADRSLTKRSSDKKPSVWSYLTDSMLGAVDTRTEFDHKVDAHVQYQKYLSQRKHKKSSLRATTIDHDLNYAVVLPMFLGEIRVG